MGCDTCPLTYPECGRKRRSLSGSFCVREQQAKMKALIDSQKVTSEVEK